jgi:hypothetical protein
MRRILIVLATAVGLATGSIAAVAIVGTPEIDQANVTWDLATRQAFVPKVCAGEDGINYRTLRGIWKGTENEVTPGATDYNLTGPITVNRVEWTINLKSQRGVLTGVVTLLPPTGGTAKTYSGSLTLITQGVPNVDRPASARGWLVAATYTDGVADGGKVLANVELKIDATFAAKGGFGDAPPLFGTPSYSVATANRTC